MRKIDRALGMESGDVLNFSNRTFAQSFNSGIDIYDAKYEYGSGSKASRMRAFWDRESNYLVGRVIFSSRSGVSSRVMVRQMTLRKSAYGSSVV